MGRLYIRKGKEMKVCQNCFEEHEEYYDICPHCGYYKGQPAKELYHLFPETILNNRYSIGKVLGFGGFGITYKAWDRKLETVVAIKEYYPSGLVNRIPGEKEVILFAGNKSKEFHYGLERFLDEARNTAKFGSHKNIVNVFEYFEENQTAYIVMEFLDGISLSTYLKTNSLDVDSSLELIRNVCGALREVHAHGIIHRDVSPDNIFVCFNGSVKLIDFGAARFSSNEERQLTIILKPGFAPPEQYEQISAQGPWTDIYALGATLYYMLTGQKPEESTNRKVEDTLLPPHEIDPEIPENLSNSVMKAMAIEKHLRFDKVEDFEKAINGDKKIIPLAKEKKKRKKKRMIGILSVALVILIMAGILGSRLMKQKEEETLPPANIILLYIQNGDTFLDGMKHQALVAIAESFESSFPDVKIEVCGAPGDCYIETYEELCTREDATVAVFESTDLMPEELKATATDLSALALGENTGCHFIERYDTLYPERLQMPVGFVVPVIYCNKTIAQYEGAEITSLQQLRECAGNSKGIAVDVSVASSVCRSFGVAESEFDVVETVDEFANGGYAFYIASTELYSAVQSVLPARFCVIPISTQTVFGTFAEEFSVRDELTEDENKVAMAFMNYMLSANAQDLLYIQNWTGQLPVNGAALTVVEDVYSELYGLFENVSRYTIEP